MTNNIIIIAVIANAIISQVIATSVKNRQISSSRVFWLSFLLSPLVGMFVAMMSPEVKPNEVNEQTDGQLNLPKYEDDKFIEFIDKNMKTIYIGFLIIFLLSGLWK
jgi:hypothetical protein